MAMQKCLNVLHFINVNNAFDLYNAFYKSIYRANNDKTLHTQMYVNENVLPLRKKKQQEIKSNYRKRN